MRIYEHLFISHFLLCHVVCEFRELCASALLNGFLMLEKRIVITQVDYDNLCKSFAHLLYTFIFMNVIDRTLKLSSFVRDKITRLLHLVTRGIVNACI